VEDSDGVDSSGWVPKMSLSEPVKSILFVAGGGEVSEEPLDRGEAEGLGVGDDLLKMRVMMLPVGEGLGVMLGVGVGELDGVGVGEVAGEQSLVFTSKTGEY